MFLTDTLIVIGVAAINLGTINESDGLQERSFWLRNDGNENVTMVQGYTSCGCTTIMFPKDKTIFPKDSVNVTLRFNPNGKGGEFYESGTIVYGQARKRLQLAMYGNCISSEETLMKQFPIRVNDYIRISDNRFDLGRMRIGEKKERTIVALHQDDGNRKELIHISFSPNKEMKKGLNHYSYPITIKEKEEDIHFSITLDFILD